jgi:hypothetical protein
MGHPHFTTSHRRRARRIGGFPPLQVPVEHLGHRAIRVDLHEPSVRVEEKGGRGLLRDLEPRQDLLRPSEHHPVRPLRRRIEGAGVADADQAESAARDPIAPEGDRAAIDEARERPLEAVEQERNAEPTRAGPSS